MSEVLVLCYHAVSERWPAALSVTPERLERQLRRLRAWGFHGVTFTQAIEAPPAGRAVALTFDDAYRSVITRALPILADAGFPATVFAPTDHIGSGRPMSWPGIEQWRGGPHEDELVPAGWDELGQLVDAGWEVGSHTCSHPRLPLLDDDALRRELELSRAEIVRRIGPCPAMAYPYGDVDARVVAAAGDCGYRAAAALTRPRGSPGPLAQPRVGIYNRDAAWRFRLKAWPVARKLPIGPAYRAVAARGR